MEIFTINSSNRSTAETAITTGGKYFIVTSDLTFTNKSIRIGAGSILEFRGGSFSADSPATLDLNSTQIIAGPYPIFGKNIKVSGMANAEVRAEWFRSAE